MTNGEVLQKAFPNSELETLSTKIVFTLEPRTLRQQVFVFDKDWWDAEYKEPTTMNNLAQERYQDLIEYFGSKEVAKAILGNRKEFKAWLERLRWNVKRADELARELEQIKGTTKNDLGVDCISREQAKAAIRDKFKDLPSRVEINTILNELPSVTPQLSSELEKNSKKLEKDFGELDCISRADAINAVSEALKHTFVEHEDIANKIIGKLPTITPQEPQTFKWCTDCKEYDQEKHCCHRWSKVIRNTVEELKLEYIEREVLDKIDEVITDALDKSTDQKESQTLRWVLDKISEVM